MIVAGRPALVLAPMEGVTDAPMRALQGETGAFTYAVTEFLRVSQQVPPRGVFLHHVPELGQGSLTPTGLPVQVQILGGDPERMAETARRACELGAWGVDLNFGCPAKTVNRHDGGATLLKYPDRLGAIVHAVREAVPAHLPVSAKMRLGWDETSAILTNAVQAARAGANWITVHARTRAQGYQPPVDWHRIGEVRRLLDIPVVANGDIWTLEDFRRCWQVTGCEHFMLGRGALANPCLPAAIAAELGIAPPEATAWAARQLGPRGEFDWKALLARLCHWGGQFPDLAASKSLPRLKQWLRFAHERGTFRHFDAAKRARGVEELFSLLDGAALAGVPQPPQQVLIAEAGEDVDGALPVLGGAGVAGG